MTLADLVRTPIEQRLSPRAKRALLAIMTATILVLLLALEQSGGTPFLYIGF